MWRTQYAIKKNIIIIGTGRAGTMMANKLNQTLDVRQWQITILDRANTHYYQPGFLFILFGLYKPEAVVKKRFHSRGCALFD